MTFISRQRDNLMTGRQPRPQIFLIVATTGRLCQCFEQSIPVAKCLSQTRRWWNTRRAEASNPHRNGLTLSPTEG